MARQSVVEFYDKSYGQRSKAPTIAASTQGDSRDFLPTAGERATINSSHTTTHKYRKSVYEFYDKRYGQRSKAPTIAASTQGDSRDFLPTARE